MALLHIVWGTKEVWIALFRPELNLRAQHFTNLPQVSNLREVKDLWEVNPANLIARAAPASGSSVS